MPRVKNFSLTNTPLLFPSPFFCPPLIDGWGIWTALNATHATWNFHTVKSDNGPADYSDSLTIIRNH